MFCYSDCDIQLLKSFYSRYFMFLIVATIYSCEDAFATRVTAFASQLQKPRSNCNFSTSCQPGLNGQVIDFPRRRVVSSSSSISELFLFVSAGRYTHVVQILELMAYLHAEFRRRIELMRICYFDLVLRGRLLLSLHVDLYLVTQPSFYLNFFTYKQFSYQHNRYPS
ncbi:hypothetical protein BDQ17DRAFT_399912 [Cyathus striatus]|nr:hypothetical protein BDQ17DRAFT_399912 [Cyathus striatus]